MITSTSTNFGVNSISLKCTNSAKLVVLQGMFTIDTSNADYQVAQQLEITFPSQFQVRNSKPTTAFLICQKDDLQSGTIVKAQIQGKKLIIEKLPIYDGKITFSGKDQEGQSKKYLSRAFTKFFYVRELVIDEDGSAVFDKTPSPSNAERPPHQVTALAFYIISICL